MVKARKGIQLIEQALLKIPNLDVDLRGYSDPNYTLNKIFGAQNFQGITLRPGESPLIGAEAHRGLDSKAILQKIIQQHQGDPNSPIALLTAFDAQAQHYKTIDLQHSSPTEIKLLDPFGHEQSLGIDEFVKNHSIEGAYFLNGRPEYENYLKETSSANQTSEQPNSALDVTQENHPDSSNNQHTNQTTRKLGKSTSRLFDLVKNNGSVKAIKETFGEADIFARDEHGNRAIDYATIESVKRLLKNQMAIERADENSSPNQKTTLLNKNESENAASGSGPQGTHKRFGLAVINHAENAGNSVNPQENPMFQIKEDEPSKLPSVDWKRLNVSQYADFDKPTPPPSVLSDGSSVRPESSASQASFMQRLHPPSINKSLKSDEGVSSILSGDSSVNLGSSYSQASFLNRLHPQVVDKSLKSETGSSSRKAPSIASSRETMETVSSVASALSPQGENTAQKIFNKLQEGHGFITDEEVGQLVPHLNKAVAKQVSTLLHENPLPHLSKKDYQQLILTNRITSLNNSEEKDPDGQLPDFWQQVDKYFSRAR